MASEFFLTTGNVTPQDTLGPRVGVGARVLASRDSPGGICMQILRGIGGATPSFDYIVRSIWYGPFAADEEAELVIARIDLGLPNFDPRPYRLRVIADGGAELKTRLGFISTEPYAPAGIQS